MFMRTGNQTENLNASLEGHEKRHKRGSARPIVIHDGISALSLVARSNWRGRGQCEEGSQCKKAHFECIFGVV